MPMSLRFDLIKSIIEHGARFSPGETVDPSTNPALHEAGVALVTAYIEKLSFLELVREPVPIFGARGGMWIGYELSDKGRQLAESDTELRHAVGVLIGGPQNEVSEAVDSLRKNCANVKIDEAYRDNFLKTLDEMHICFDAECYIAVIALCGMILEVSLKEILNRHNINHEQNWTIGRIIREVRQNVPEEYIDPALLNVANIINDSRIKVTHPQENIPVPSRDQAIMVIFAMRDVVRRNLKYL